MKRASWVVAWVALLAGSATTGCDSSQGSAFFGSVEGGVDATRAGDAGGQTLTAGSGGGNPFGAGSGASVHIFAIFPGLPGASVCLRSIKCL